MHRNLFKFLSVAALLLGTSVSALGQSADGVSPSNLPGQQVYTYCYNGATWDRCRGSTSGVTLNQFPSPAALSDAFANPTTTNIGSFNSIFNGTTWDRQRSAAGTTGISAVNTEGTKTSYSATARQTIAGVTTNEVCFLNGSASKTIRVTRVEARLIATAFGPSAYNLSKRSTANSGGTCTTPTIVPHDSANAAASAVFTGCTDSSGQTPGALVGVVDSSFISATGGGLEGDPTKVSTFTTENAQAIVLRGTAQSLNLSLFGAAPVAGLNVYCRFQWTEE